MTNKVKRNKKYNPHKNKRAGSAETLKSFKQGLFYCVDGETTDVKLLSFKDYELRNPTQLIYEAIAGVDHKWYYTLFFLCRTQQGEEYVTAYYPDFKSNVSKKIVTDSITLSHTDAAALMQPVHKELLTKINPMHKVTTGWIACPYNKRVEPEQISAIADKYNLWRFSTLWEHEQDLKNESRPANV